MARGDLGEFFVNTANALQRQQYMADESLLRKAQTSNLLQKMKDDKDMEEAMSGIDPTQYDNPYEPIGEAAKRAPNPRVKAQLIQQYATTREAHFKGLTKNLEQFKEDPEAFNDIIQSSAYKDYRKQYGIKDGGVINPKAGEQYYTHTASPDNPLETPKGILTEGTYEVKEKRGQITQWLRKDRDEQSVADIRNFEMVTGIDKAKRGTPEYKQSYMNFKKEVGEQRPINIQFIPTSEGIVKGNPRTGQMGGETGFGKPMSNEMVTALQQIGTLKDALGEVETLYTVDKEKKKYRDEWVGPAAGRLGNIAEQTIGVDPERSKFMAANAQMGNTLVYLMSGKQINETEYQRLKKQLPDVNLPPKNYRARLDEFKRTLNSIIDQRKKNMGGYIPKEVGNKPSARPPLDSFERK